MHYTIMNERLTATMAAIALLLAVTVPGDTLAQNEPITIITTGLTCSNGVCALGTGNVGTFLNLAISSSGGTGPTPFTWKVVQGKLPKV